MDRKRLSSTRPHMLSSPRFRLDVFEKRLRTVLQVDASRPAGTPGSDGRKLCDDPRNAVKQYLIDELLSKYDDETGSDTKALLAFEKFWKAEEVCYWRNFFFAQDKLDIENRYPALRRARKFIHEFMGPVVDLDRIARGFGWGPGASTRLPRLRGDACYKYSGKPEVTPNAYAYGCAAIALNPLWKHEVDNVEQVPVVWGNRLTTVPKNYKIDRVIAVEPDLNMFLQKGLGSFIRQKLKALDIDLNDQTRNQFAARDLSLATIDFSMASDSVSQGIVDFLFPGPWVDLIQDLRSEVAVLPDKTLHRYSKVSSMGNGFTFELETLIFLALAYAVTASEEHHRVSVYGDDVIIPVAAVPEFVSLSSVCGFTVNEKKSFWTGPFRESCGKHFHSGHDVTPFYIKSPVKRLEDLFLVHNQLWRWLEQVQELLSYDEWLGIRDILRSLRNLAPAKWRRPRLPDGFGDGAFIGSFASCSPRTNRDGWEYFDIEVWEMDSQIVDVELPGLLVKSLTNLHKRRKVLPEIYEPSFAALPTHVGRRRRRLIVVPWSAWG